MQFSVGVVVIIKPALSEGNAPRTREERNSSTRENAKKKHHKQCVAQTDGEQTITILPLWVFFFYLFHFYAHTAPCSFAFTHPTF